MDINLCDDNLYVNKTKSGFIVFRLASLFHNIEESRITVAHVDSLVDHIKFQYQNGINPISIIRSIWPDAPKHNYSSLFLSFKIKLITATEWKQKVRRDLTERRQYWLDCAFKFDVYAYPIIPGYELLKTGSFHITSWQEVHTDAKRLLLHRDHMYSIYDGWINKADFYLISHIANCRIIWAKENTDKNVGSCISLEELKSRVDEWDSGNFTELKILKHEKRYALRSPEYRKKISDTLKGRVWCKRIY